MPSSHFVFEMKFVYAVLTMIVAWKWEGIGGLVLILGGLAFFTIVRVDAGRGAWGWLPN